MTIFLSFFLNADSEIMKVSEIKPGMEGEGRTIFKGSKIETFPFKVLGVIEKFSAHKDLIIVELDSPVLKEAGIIAGMSGSPAYINGKMIGSISYGFGFSKRPIGGITPIEDILETSKYNHKAKNFSIDVSDLKVEFNKKNLARIADLLQKELIHRINFSPSNSITPIKLLTAQSGFSPSALSYMNPIFSPVSALQVKGATPKKGLKGLELAKGMLNLRAADAVSIPLIKGDFEYASLGTVTHVDGEDVYMFGHPFFNLGAVDFPMHRAEVITVVPSYQNSFKLASTREMVGRVQQDRFSSVQGQLGKSPYMIPMKVTLQKKNKTFNLELVNHSLLTPALSAISLANIFTSQYQEFGQVSIQVQGKIYIEGEQNIILDDIFTGTESFNNFNGLLMAINFFLMNNRERDIKIQKLDFQISGSEHVRRTSIENVLVNKNSFLPGEIMYVDIYLNNERGQSFTENLTIKAPNLKSGSTFYLLVADNAAMSSFDSKNVKSTYFPMKLKPLIRAINNLRKNNRVYLKLMTPSSGLFVKGHEYSNLPSSLQNVFEYNSSPIYGTDSGSQSRIKYSTIMEYQVKLPAVVKGKKLFKLKIKERSDAN